MGGQALALALACSSTTIFVANLLYAAIFCGLSGAEERESLCVSSKKVSEVVRVLLCYSVGFPSERESV